MTLLVCILWDGGRRSHANRANRAHGPSSVASGTETSPRVDKGPSFDPPSIFDNNGLSMPARENQGLAAVAAEIRPCAPSKDSQQANEQTHE